MGEDSCPLVRDNNIEASLFAGIFAEAGAKANVLGNSFLGSSPHRLSQGTTSLHPNVRVNSFQKSIDPREEDTLKTPLPKEGKRKAKVFLCLDQPGPVLTTLCFAVSRASGFGLLWLNGAAGVIGKNHFQHYQVSPVMIFSQVSSQEQLY